MSCALDSNVLLALVSGDEARAEAAAGVLDRARPFGRLIISGAVFAELRGATAVAVKRIDQFLRAAEIDVDWNADEALWRAAGEAYGSYVKRRRDDGAGLPRRLLTDFLIGAHALRCGVLLTYDRRLFAASFPRLKLIGAP